MAFITQRGEVHSRGARQTELSELEALVCGIDQISQSTLLLKKMKEMSEVDDSLEYMKEQYERRMANCVEREAAYKKKQAVKALEYEDSKKDISAADAKRLRAELKKESEEASFKQKELEQVKLLEELAASEAERTKLVAELSSLRKYQRYLDKTVEVSEDAEEVWDLLNRHKTLTRAYDDLMTQVTEGEAAIDELRMEMQSFTSAHTNHMLVQNSSIHESQQKLERIKRENKQKEDVRLKREEDVKGATRSKGQVALAIRNVYLRCLNTMHAKVAVIPEPTDSSNQLAVLENCLKLVAERICDLTDIEAGYPAWEARRGRAEEMLKAEAAASKALAAITPASGAGGGN